MKKLIFSIALGSLFLTSCSKTTLQSTQQITKSDQPFVWNGANVYFLLTDRFNNGDSTNDVNYGRTQETAKLRGFEGGDIRGIIQKIEEGYFTNLGVNAIWMTPLVEQIHGAVDEGQGPTYGFHGYWTKDWTTLDRNFGTEKDLQELVDKAHAKGIRIMLDAVINHTGPVTELDAVFPADWVRVSPHCTYDNYVNTTACTLVKNLPDILTESESNVTLPPQLLEKWQKEGRLRQEIEELNTFFAKYNLPKAPKYYIMKWLSDYIRDYGIDAYRVDTVKHTEEDVWKVFAEICKDAFNEYKAKNPHKVLDNNEFFLLGEVYNYTINEGQNFSFPDKKVNYFEHGFDALINFDLRSTHNETFQKLFNRYDDIIHNEMKGKTVMNYISSHDDGSPYDKNRKDAWDAGTKLLLTPGMAQIYYGDEIARPLEVDGADGDANLRSFMNWEDIQSNSETKELLSHFQKLGQFRHNHPAVGAGKQTVLQAEPYIFHRKYNEDEVIIAMDYFREEKVIDVAGLWTDGTKVRDAYSGEISVVKNGRIVLASTSDIVLLEKVK
ncbi:MAG: alpha-amylase [Weeksellaceae bacterium]|nr:alpha-amylase [Weeksellaceae bacterium]